LFLLYLPDILLAALLELNLQLTVWQGLIGGHFFQNGFGVVAVIAEEVQCSIHHFCRLNE